MAILLVLTLLILTRTLSNLSSKLALVLSFCSAGGKIPEIFIL
ncbi:MAG: hypothetical protein GX664_05990 [Bacteroidales bacterium]|nr:hypothetical protein [Bacteroidales bacterium]